MDRHSNYADQVEEQT